ncbi:MAG: PIN domain-containing protein [Microbacteriaceae bacterium]|nr:PIN domain-containing protein [Cryobacterium sp.]MBX3104597.1 PIN domain-containing protein [Cryobacterium sp.]MCC6377076.1 PIN domain-containing protein [Microbacteriaceae bacterium]
MILLDVNVVLAAYRGDHAHHTVAKGWLDKLLDSPESFGVPDLVWVGFLRLVTNSHVFDVPSTPAEAFEFIEAVCSAPTYVSIPGLGSGFEKLKQLVLASDAWGNLIPDAYLAAVALSYASKIATFDRDFRRFDAVSVITPN